MNSINTIIAVVAALVITTLLAILAMPSVEKVEVWCGQSLELNYTEQDKYCAELAQQYFAVGGSSFLPLCEEEKSMQPTFPFVFGAVWVMYPGSPMLNEDNVPVWFTHQADGSPLRRYED